ncbi:MAG: response regulator, partial [Deltaproteobacteria bacterium]
MPKSLLLADDSITIQRVVGITFANEDYTITTVDNGDDAIAKAKEIKPDIILADVVMPKKTGYEVCQAVKQDPELKHIPVLLLAGHFEAFDENRAKEVGADGHITKPFESQALIDK